MSKVIAWLGKRRKAGAALTAVGLGWAQLVVYSKPGPITAPEWIVLATGVAGVLGVHAVTNDTTPTEGPVA